MPCLSWRFMREAGGFVAAGLPASPGARCHGPRFAVRLGRVRSAAVGAVRTVSAWSSAASRRGAALEAPARELSPFRATPWRQMATVRQTAHTSRAGRRFVRLTLLCGVKRRDLEPGGGRCAISRAARGVRGGPGGRRNARTVAGRMKYVVDAGRAIRGPNSAARRLSTEDRRVFGPLMARRLSLGT